MQSIPNELEFAVPDRSAVWVWQRGTSVADDSSLSARELHCRPPLLGVLGGMGPLATAEFMSRLARATPASCDQDHIPMIVCSIPQIPTDLDFAYKPVLTSYLDWPALPAGLLARGMHHDEAAMVMGGNFLRVLQAHSPSTPKPTEHRRHS